MLSKDRNQQPSTRIRVKLCPVESAALRSGDERQIGTLLEGPDHVKLISCLRPNIQCQTLSKLGCGRQGDHLDGGTTCEQIQRSFVATAQAGPSKSRAPVIVSPCKRRWTFRGITNFERRLTSQCWLSKYLGMADAILSHSPLGKSGCRQAKHDIREMTVLTLEREVAELHQAIMRISTANAHFSVSWASAKASPET